jgi:hypothetical protein
MVDPIYPMDIDHIDEVVEFWKGARDSSREEMRARYKTGEFGNMHPLLMKALIEAYHA